MRRVAGGVVLRRGVVGLEVVLVERKRFHDWAIPKGHVEHGEADKHAALREVREETGLDCCAVTMLGALKYFDRKGVAKFASYWLMLPQGSDSPETRVPHEIDTVRWVALEAACQLASRDGERAVLVHVFKNVRTLDGIESSLNVREPFFLEER